MMLSEKKVYNMFLTINKKYMLRKKTKKITTVSDRFNIYHVPRSTKDFQCITSQQSCKVNSMIIPNL